MEQSETAEKLVKLLKKKNLTVTTAESCTGGMNRQCCRCLCLF